MFNHVELDFEIEKLKTVNIEGKRLYETPDGLKYPSITTVLGWFSAKGIMAWRKRVGEKEANKISSDAGAAAKPHGQSRRSKASGAGTRRRPHTASKPADKPNPDSPFAVLAGLKLKG